MNHLNSQAQLKDFASALRAAVKAETGTPFLSHAKVLDLVARALGENSFSHFKSKYPVSLEEAPPAARYPLKNTDGRFDLRLKNTAPGADFCVYHGASFVWMQAAFQVVPCTTGLGAVSGRQPGGAFEWQGVGETRLDWSNQKDELDATGESRYVNEDTWLNAPASACMLGPEDWEEPSAFFSEKALDLTIREELLQEFLELANSRGISEAALLECLLEEGPEGETVQRLGGELGFLLHFGESAVLIERLSQATAS